VLSSPSRWPDLFPFFFLGAGLYVFRGWVPLSHGFFGMTVAVLLASLFVGGSYFAFLTCGTYAILYAALKYSGELRIVGRRVDLSYGVYLYGWPIQQLLVYFTDNGTPPLELFIVSLGLTLPVALLSWTFVERPSLTLVRNVEGRKTLRDGATA
jgi:peptidoglycan/LPS O-acetylase OafA/YrhL